MEEKLVERIDSRDSSASCRSKQPGSTSAEKQHDGFLDAAELGGDFCRSGEEGQREKTLRRNPAWQEQGQIPREGKGPRPEGVGLPARVDGISCAQELVSWRPMQSLMGGLAENA